eukprot:gnl/MRDRNA2_/MRDRNA2_76431_c0_seq1.p1 gnl/MRDRNA2_/MRDRNA2_76431_c0~~gnl/MRDRNA2_/MRDRNA2_76431_c0_seq1.p1  ORF type:complete len:784 (+),score=181.55 gnl/MRDRNA2_/MRDRNA2_76431_c0_seq1:132-2483(+)
MTQQVASVPSDSNDKLVQCLEKLRRAQQKTATEKLALKKTLDNFNVALSRFKSQLDSSADSGRASGTVSACEPTVGDGDKLKGKGASMTSSELNEIHEKGELKGQLREITEAPRPVSQQNDSFGKLPSSEAIVGGHQAGDIAQSFSSNILQDGSLETVMKGHETDNGQMLHRSTIHDFLDGIVTSPDTLNIMQASPGNAVEHQKDATENLVNESTSLGLSTSPKLNVEANSHATSASPVGGDANDRKSVLDAPTSSRKLLKGKAPLPAQPKEGTMNSAESAPKRRPKGKPKARLSVGPERQSILESEKMQATQMQTIKFDGGAVKPVVANDFLGDVADHQVLDGAAVKIQSVYRGKCARQEVSTIKSTTSSSAGKGIAESTTSAQMADATQRMPIVKNPAGVPLNASNIAESTISPQMANATQSGPIMRKPVGKPVPLSASARPSVLELQKMKAAQTQRERFEKANSGASELGADAPQRNKLISRTDTQKELKMAEEASQELKRSLSSKQSTFAEGLQHPSSVAHLTSQPGAEERSLPRGETDPGPPSADVNMESKSKSQEGSAPPLAGVGAERRSLLKGRAPPPRVVAKSEEESAPVVDYSLTKSIEPAMERRSLQKGRVSTTNTPGEAHSTNHQEIEPNRGQFAAESQELKGSASKQRVGFAELQTSQAPVVDGAASPDPSQKALLKMISEGSLVASANSQVDLHSPTSGDPGAPPRKRPSPKGRASLKRASQAAVDTVAAEGDMKSEIHNAHGSSETQVAPVDSEQEPAQSTKPKSGLFF